MTLKIAAGRVAVERVIFDRERFSRPTVEASEFGVFCLRLVCFREPFLDVGV